SSLVVHPEVPEASETVAPPVAAPPLAEPGIAPEGPRPEARGPEVAAAREPERTRTDARTSSETPAASKPVQAPEEPRVTGPHPTEPRTSPAIARAGEEVTRLKGLEPTLALFRRTPRGAEPLKPGAAVRSGDVLRIGYRAAGRSFGAIFSVDGHGN